MITQFNIRLTGKTPCRGLWSTIICQIAIAIKFWTNTSENYIKRPWKTSAMTIVNKQIVYEYVGKTTLFTFEILWVWTKFDSPATSS